jgi:hypothetical protein
MATIFTPHHSTKNAKRRYFVPYIISKATDPLKIKEQEYASAEKEIMFTGFTSCIGVIAKEGATLTAVHLVMVANDGSIFDVNAAINVLNLLPEKPDAVTIFGCISLWDNPENKVVPAFQKLTGKYQTLKKYQQYTFGPGTYGAKIDDDDIEITYPG